MLTIVSMLGPPLLAPAAVAALAPEAMTVALSCAGLAVVIAGKITLGRSFALMPANRGVVSTGLYRIVRHPIYMGYLVTHVAFLVASPSLWNIVALVAADARAARPRGLRGADAGAGSGLPRLPDPRALASRARGVLDSVRVRRRDVHVPVPTCGATCQRLLRLRDPYRESGDRGAEVSSRIVVEALDERMLLERRWTMPRWTPVPRP